MTKIITLEELSQHKNQSSCWVSIHNKVYDVTNFLDEHPGGDQVVLDVGGTFATEAFEDVGHSIDARDLLNQFYVGELAEKDQEKPEAAHDAEVNPAGGSSLWKIAVPLVLGVTAIVVWRYLSCRR